MEEILGLRGLDGAWLVSAWKASTNEEFTNTKVLETLFCAVGDELWVAREEALQQFPPLGLSEADFRQAVSDILCDVQSAAWSSAELTLKHVGSNKEVSAVSSSGRYDLHQTAGLFENLS